MRGKFKVTLTSTRPITSFIPEEREEFLFTRIGQLVRDREYKEIEIFNGEGKLIFTYKRVV